MQALFENISQINTMRYSPDHKVGARARLIEATGALVKKNGFAATGVDGLMAAAGLTSGAFYSHFRSKSELLEAIIENELKRSIELFSDKTREQAVAAIKGYLSPAHVAHPESGCAVPSLAPEIARASESTQYIFEQGVLELKDQIRKLVRDDAKAWSIVVQLVGAVMVARGLPSEQTRKALLKGVAQQVKQILEEGSGPS
ncbi:TetR/AcrR family transcriptional regulator [Rhodoferax sp.]|uniref:TetR/AcrR family transcriptional regulator n=1 Tax=Rhodoferax sp. TaxID=50421 RepID=UPI00374D2B60